MTVFWATCRIIIHLERLDAKIGMNKLMVNNGVKVEASEILEVASIDRAFNLHLNLNSKLHIRYKYEHNQIIVADTQSNRLTGLHNCKIYVEYMN